jgi:hypothetical protein
LGHGAASPAHVLLDAALAQQSGHDIAAAAAVARYPSRTLWVAPSPASRVNETIENRPLPVYAYSGHSAPATALLGNR